METVSNQIIIDASPTRVWGAAADLAGVHKYWGMVKASRLSSEKATGLRASRICEMLDGSSMEETIIQWDQGDSYALDTHTIGTNDGPFKTAIGRFAFHPEGSGTRFALDLDFELKSGREAELSDRSAELDMACISFVSGLKTHVETGHALTLEQKQAAMAAMMSQ